MVHDVFPTEYNGYLSHNVCQVLLTMSAGGTYEFPFNLSSTRTENKTHGNSTFPWHSSDTDLKKQILK